MTIIAPAPAEKRYKVKDASGTVIGAATQRRVPVAAIKMVSGYQRDLDMKWVAKHLPWDERKSGPIILSDRLGGPYCLDGQHRVAMARESGIHDMLAFVITGLTKQDEARLFVGYNQDRRALKSWDLFKAQLEAGDAQALEIVRIASQAGFTISPITGDDHIAAVEAVKRTHRLGSEALLKRVLGVLRSAWFGEAKATSGQIIYGLALFFRACAGQAQFSEERFNKVLRDYAPARVLREAQTVAEKRSATSSSASNVAEALFDLYNQPLKPEKRLAKLTIGGKRRPRPTA